jgi:hypothetical protein
MNLSLLSCEFENGGLGELLKSQLLTMPWIRAALLIRATAETT